jgi:hypothetical protein
MDTTGRRQSTNVDDRRKNWRLYEAFRPLQPQPEVMADNRHTQAVEQAAYGIEMPPVIRMRRPAGTVPEAMSQGEFDGLLDDELPAGTSDARSIISNLLRK